MFSFQECSRYLTPEQISSFLDDAIRIRIAVRLIAEQHIALTRALTDKSFSADHLGVIHMTCSPRNMIQMCGTFVTELCDATLGSSPEIIVDGDFNATFP